MEIVSGLDAWFTKRLAPLPVSDDTRAYVVGVFSKRKHEAIAELARESVVSAFISAREKRDFASFQRLGDHVLWVETFCPEAVEQNFDTVTRFAKISYYRCFRLAGCTWQVYEELADNLPTIASNARALIIKF
jgi:hypothetical protein